MQNKQAFTTTPRSPAPGDNRENGLGDIWRLSRYDINQQLSDQGQKPGHATCNAFSDSSWIRENPPLTREIFLG